LTYFKMVEVLSGAAHGKTEFWALESSIYCYESSGSQIYGCILKRKYHNLEVGTFFKNLVPEKHRDYG
jgi:hypothetical protein